MNFGLSQYRKTIVGVLTFLSVLFLQLQQIGGPNVRTWTIIAAAIGAFLTYLTPNTPPSA